MKKVLRFAIVVSIIFTMLSINIASLAANLPKMINKNSKETEQTLEATESRKLSEQENQQTTSTSGESTSLKDQNEGQEANQNVVKIEGKIMPMSTTQMTRQQVNPKEGKLPGSLELKID